MRVWVGYDGAFATRGFGDEKVFDQWRHLVYAVTMRASQAT